jgi:hypothetical protein
VPEEYPGGFWHFWHSVDQRTLKNTHPSSVLDITARGDRSSLSSLRILRTSTKPFIVLEPVERYRGIDGLLMQVLRVCSHQPWDLISATSKRRYLNVATQSGFLQRPLHKGSDVRVLLKYFLGYTLSIMASRPSGIVGYLNHNFDDLLLGYTLMERALDVPFQLAISPQCREQRYRNHTALRHGKLFTAPNFGK